VSEILNPDWFKCGKCGSDSVAWGAMNHTNGIRIEVRCFNCETEAYIFPFEENKENGKDPKT